MYFGCRVLHHWIYVWFTDTHQRSQNLCRLDPGMGLNLVVFGFSRKWNNCGLPGAYVTCMYCDLSVKTNRHKTPYGVRRSWTHIVNAFALHLFFSVWSAKSEDGWGHHYTGWYRRSEISGVYLWYGLISAFINKIFWWHESEDINKRGYFPKFNWF